MGDGEGWGSWGCPPPWYLYKRVAWGCTAWLGHWWSRGCRQHHPNVALRSCRPPPPPQSLDSLGTSEDARSKRHSTSDLSDVPFSAVRKEGWLHCKQILTKKGKVSGYRPPRPRHLPPQPQPKPGRQRRVDAPLGEHP